MTMARVGASMIATCGGPKSDCTQHCVPQPAAQGQPPSWPAGGGELSVEAAAAHRLEWNGLPAATDSGSSKACSATT